MSTLVTRVIIVIAVIAAIEMIFGISAMSTLVIPVFIMIAGIAVVFAVAYLAMRRIGLPSWGLLTLLASPLYGATIGMILAFLIFPTSMGAGAIIGAVASIPISGIVLAIAQFFRRQEYLTRLRDLMRTGHIPPDTMPGTLRFDDEATMDRRLGDLEERMEVRYVPCIAMPPNRSAAFESWDEVCEEESDCRAYLMIPMSNRLGRELDDAVKLERLVPWNPFAGVMIVRGGRRVFGVADHPFCHKVFAVLREDSQESESDS